MDVLKFPFFQRLENFRNNTRVYHSSQPPAFQDLNAKPAKSFSSVISPFLFHLDSMAHLSSALQVEFARICIRYYTVHQCLEIPSQQHVVRRLAWSESKAFFNKSIEKVENVYPCI